MNAKLYNALKDIVYYDGHAEWLCELKNNIEEVRKNGHYVLANPFDAEEWHTEKHVIWMLLVGMFGDWGTSIRGGWIEDFDGCISFIDSLIKEED
jgi:hypothetical protein